MNVVAAGGFNAKGGWRRWIAKGLTNLNGHVDYVHTKFMLVDPLGDDPLVVPARPTGATSRSATTTRTCS